MSYRKSTRRDQVEGAFEETLKALEPSETAYALLRDMFKHAWDLRRAQMQSAAKAMSGKLTELEVQISALLDRIVKTTNPRVISTYEAKIDALERD